MNDARAMAQQLEAAIAQVRRLEAELRKQAARSKGLEAQLQEREARLRELEQRVAPTHGPATPRRPDVESPAFTSEPELEETLKRLVTKIAMILQAGKCVFLLHDQRSGELFGHGPAFGVQDLQVRALRMPHDQGLSGAVLQSGKPLIVGDLANDPRAAAWEARILNARNSASVPLIIERRDEEGRVTQRKPVGVLHVFDKRYGGCFNEEDIHLLSILSRNHAAIIANAKLFFEVVEEKDKMEATLESLTAGLVLVGTNGKIMLMNQSAEAMLAVRGQEEVGKPYEDVVQDERVKEMLRMALAANQEVTRAEIVRSQVDPETGEEHESVIQAQTALVKSTDTREVIGVALVLTDITEIRDVERMKSAFISTVSHELNTPLTAIKGFISTLRQDTEGFYDVRTRQDFYQIIDSECDRLSRLIGNLLHLSRIESGHSLDLDLQPVHLGPLVERVAEAQRAYVGNHEIVTRVFPGLPPIMADAAKVDQILTNVMANAIKFSPGGGRITVEVVPDDGFVRFSVSDEGIGIPPEHLPRVFDRFYRVDNRDTRDTYGAGIGLYLVKHLVEAHGGTVSVESEPGKGTTVTFRLPVRPSGEAMPAD